MHVRTSVRVPSLSAATTVEVNLRKPIIVLLLCAFVVPCLGQEKFVAAWEQRVRKTSSQQPGWAVPVFAPSSGLVQLIRFDAVRQYTPTHTTTWNIDGGKGFNFIPWYKTELDLNLPPFLFHNAKGTADGPGDSSMLLKYRFLGANESKGNYSMSAALGGSAPTGSYKNGSPDGAITPTIFVGKGFRSFDVQSAAAGTSQVSANISNVRQGAVETGSASSQVLSAARSLSGDSNRLKLEVGRFLETVRAA